MTFDDMLADLPLIAILRGVTPDEVIAVGGVLVAAGLRCLEVPLNSPEALVSIRALAGRFGDQAVVGAGTVLDVEAVKTVRQAGGRIIVSPNCDTTVIRATKDAGMTSLPAFLSPSEALAALAAGADALKLFPAEIAKPAGLRAVRAILPSATSILPVGGIEPASMATWCASGASGFGLGSVLFHPDRSLAELERRAHAIVEAWRTTHPV